MRTINVPIMALLFFERTVQPRLKFEQGKAGNVKRFDGLAEPSAIWMIEYQETAKGTMVRGTNDRDIPSRGRIWLDSSNGRVLRTEMISEDTSLRAEINVSYKTESGLDLLVPDEMREIYTIRRNDTRIDGRATYGHFRRFTVATTEKAEVVMRFVGHATDADAPRSGESSRPSSLRRYLLVHGDTTERDAVAYFLGAGITSFVAEDEGGSSECTS
jgi:hypothetical protein